MLQLMWLGKASLPAITQASEFRKCHSGFIGRRFECSHPHEAQYANVLERCYIPRQLVPLIFAEATLGGFLGEMEFQQYVLRLAQLPGFVVNGHQQPLAIDRVNQTHQRQRPGYFVPLQMAYEMPGCLR